MKRKFHDDVFIFLSESRGLLTFKSFNEYVLVPTLPTELFCLHGNNDG